METIFVSELFYYDLVAITHKIGDSFADVLVRVSDTNYRSLNLSLLNDKSSNKGLDQISNKINDIDGTLIFDNKDKAIIYFLEDSNDFEESDYTLFIRGILPTVSSAKLLSSKITASEQDIIDFNFSGSDIFCNISPSYSEVFDAFNNANDQPLIKAFIDKSNHISIAGQAYVGTSIEYFESLNASSVGGRSFQSSSLRYLKCENLTTISQRAFLNMSGARRFKLPALTTIDDVNAFGNFLNNQGFGTPKIYMSEAMSQTPIVQSLSKSFDAIPILDTTLPGAPSSISVSNIQSNSIDISFKNQPHVNNIEFTEVWIDFGNGIFWMHDEINQSTGNTVVNLPSSSNLRMKLKACDQYYNESNFSEIVSFSTL